MIFIPAVDIGQETVSNCAKVRFSYFFYQEGLN